MFGWFKPKNGYSLKRLKELHIELKKLSQHFGPIADNELTEVLRELAELLVLGEKQSDSYFEYFLEANMLRDIIDIIKQDRKNKLQIQIIQTISILVQNIKSVTSLFFLLSNNFINDLITTPLDFMDEDVVSQYISFLKLLSTNLNKDTIQFFYNYTGSADPFPLFSTCSKFYDHQEPMVRIAVRTITLNCLRVNDENVVKYMEQVTTLKYYKKLVFYIISLMVTLDRMYLSDNTSLVGDVTLSVSDQFYFVQDMLNIQVECVNSYLFFVLTHYLIDGYCIRAVERESLVESDSKHMVIERSANEEPITLPTALFVLTLLINTIRINVVQRWTLLSLFPDHTHLINQFPPPEWESGVVSKQSSNTNDRHLHKHKQPTHTIPMYMNGSKENDVHSKTVQVISIATTPLPSDSDESERSPMDESPSIPFATSVSYGSGTVSPVVPPLAQRVSVKSMCSNSSTESESILSSAPSGNAADDSSSQLDPSSLKQEVDCCDGASVLPSNPLLQLLMSERSNENIKIQVLALIICSLQQIMANDGFKEESDGSKSSSDDNTSRNGSFSIWSSEYEDQLMNCLLSILCARDCRVITAQSCIYIMKYLLSNRIYGSSMKYSYFKRLGSILKLRASITKDLVNKCRSVVTYSDDIIYSMIRSLDDSHLVHFVPVNAQIGNVSDGVNESVYDNGFFGKFDTKGLIENTYVLQPLSSVTNLLTTTTSLAYRLYSINESNEKDSDLVFKSLSQQFTVYFHLRTFVFYLIRKQLVSYESLDIPTSPPVPSLQSKSSNADDSEPLPQPVVQVLPTHHSSSAIPSFNDSNVLSKEISMDIPTGSQLPLSASPRELPPVSSSATTKPLSPSNFVPLTPIPVNSSVPATPNSNLPSEWIQMASQTLRLSVSDNGCDDELVNVVNAPTMKLGQCVEISRTNRYLACTIVSSTGESLLKNPVYLAVGRSQLSLLEMVKGSMKDAEVRVVFSLLEVSDIFIEEIKNTNKLILSVMIQKDKAIDYCEKLKDTMSNNRPGRNLFKLMLSFSNVPAAKEAERCIMVARNKDIEKRMKSIDAMLDS